MNFWIHSTKIHHTEIFINNIEQESCWPIVISYYLISIIFFTCLSLRLIILICNDNKPEWSPVNNSNWTEWSAIWAEITSMISGQKCTTLGSIIPLLHPFWNRPNTGIGQFKYFIDVVLSRSEIKFIHFLGEKVNFWKQNLQNLAHDALCLLFSCNRLL